MDEHFVVFPQKKYATCLPAGRKKSSLGIFDIRDSAWIKFLQMSKFQGDLAVKEGIVQFTTPPMEGNSVVESNHYRLAIVRMKTTLYCSAAIFLKAIPLRTKFV